MSVSSPSELVASPHDSAHETRRYGFADLDGAAVAAEPGVLVATAREEDRSSLLAHVARRLRAARCRVVEVASRAPTSVFREAATQLGLGALPCNASAYATALASASPERLAIVSSLPREGSWDDAVARMLAEHGKTVLVFATTSSPPAWATATFEIRAALSASDKLRWLMAVAHESESLLREHDLHELDVWWRGTRSRLGEAPFGARSAPPSSNDGNAVPRGLSASAFEAATCVALARRSIPRAAFDRARLDSVLEELVAANTITQNPFAIVLDAAVDAALLESQASVEARESTVQMLLGERGAFEHDPWALARAAELLLTSHPIEANDLLERAGRLARDPRLVADIDERWFAAVTGLGEPHGLELRLRAAERALATGKLQQALRWCESIADADTPRARVLMARTQVQRGDLVSARLILERIPVAEVDDEIRATIAIELGELSYLTGDHAAAIADAEIAIELTTSPRTRLAARSVLGKVLLARGDWDAADTHFAADVLAAQGAGETTAELRSRLNRGIVLISKGLLDEARQMLLGVLEDGERLGEHRATALALSNLGVVAYRRRDYAAALTYWEETIEQWDALGARVEGTYPLTNLAWLRLRLGLVDNAHSILFDQKVLAGNMSPTPATQLNLVAAQVALARGSSEVAHDEVQSAMVHARASGDAQFIGATAIVGARVALADGALRQAEEWIAIATGNAKSARSVAELAMLRALHSRALGRPALGAATEALALAREAAEDDLLIDAHALVAACSRDEGDLEAARTHCSRAVAIRDRIAATLPSGVREAFVSKPEILQLAELQRSLAGVDANANDQKGPASEATRQAPARELSRSRADELVGAAPQMQSLELAIRKAALSDCTILILGESGTGKELVARALHAASARASGPLVVVNCAALVETLLLSELFGHEKGSFTGATMRRRGRFEIASGGTLFLDEIGDISARTQVALLRVLQEKTFERIGGTTTIQTDTRVVCATHRDLRVMVERGEFREDLYYRIRGITLEVPPLRARTGDIPLLAQHLLVRIASEQGRRPKGLAADALEVLLRHRWPGNVRELENVLRATTVLAEGETITLRDVLTACDDLRVADETEGDSLQPSPLEPQSTTDIPLTAAAYAHVREHRVSLHDVKRQIERDCITRALEESKGNITRAAALLGMKRPRVSQLVKQYGLSAIASADDQ
jgi:transcriptional regulator with GAF, ATPase, and Fis domain/Tfp pilus assembly protein PilF